MARRLPVLLHLAGILLPALVLLIAPQRIQAQLTASAGGYVSDMQSVMFDDIRKPWTLDNTLHNRLNFKAGLGCYANASLEVRNRFLFGETVNNTPGYAEMTGQDRGWLDLSWNLAEGSSYLLNTTIDRAFLDLNMGRLQATIGRQRINWGMNFVWNPNDIFNSYSFFDFDYVERPGSDAVRLQYYFTPATHLELVGKINNQDEFSYAGLLRFSLEGFDFQLLGGLIDEREIVAGGGFSGYFGPVSVNGELSYLHPRSSVSQPGPVTIAGIGAGYLTPFQLNVQVEYLYNEAANESNPASFADFYFRNLTVRDLSIAPHTFFTTLSYPVTPLLTLGVSSMFFPRLDGYFVGPSLDLSLLRNLDLSFIIQHFSLEFQPGLAGRATLGFLRLKWNF